MIKILFICHGNICRSPMAEFIMKNLIQKQNCTKEYEIASAATSTEELGNPVHRGTRAKLASVGISTAGKYARQMTKADYEYYDYLIAMDSMNLRNMMRIIGTDTQGKIYRLLDFGEMPRDIADPWYTGNFDITYSDILEGCQCLLKRLEENKKSFV